MEKLIKVRFAPSPTGYLHLGSLRVALFNWLFARHTKGEFIIRIEDTDFSRSEEKYVKSILDPLKWVGIESDKPITFQSSRLNLYNEVSLNLLEKNLAYRCFCAEQRSDNQGIETDYKKYSGKCSNLSIQDIEYNIKNNMPYVIRFKLPKNIQKIVFTDLIRSELSFDIDQFDDFIIVRSDHIPTYNFAVVIDDHDMNITHILRGEEHISNTPKQILLYRACQYNIPLFGHLPLILSPDGGKLSKRHAATSVDFYRQEGFLPDALCNYLVKLGWSYGDQEIFTKQELIKYFSLDGVQKSGAIFDIKKLQWLNTVYIRNSNATELFDYIIKYIDSDVFKNLKDWNKDKILKLIDLYKERVQTLKELLNNIVDLYYLNLKLNVKDVFKYVDIDYLNSLNKVIEFLQLQDNLDHEIVANGVKEIAKTSGVKLAQIAQPIRIALTGKISSPGVFDLITILDKNESITRLKSLIDQLKVLSV